MSPSPQNIRCSHTTAAGKPCRAWAIHGSDPPACAPHAGRTKGAGAPPRNQNARTHGFYATVFDPDELADLSLYAGNLSLDGEIACARFALRRVLDYLKAHTSAPSGDAEDATQPQPGDGQPRSDLSATDYTRLVGLLLQAVRTVARLVRDQYAVPARSASLYPDELAELLAELVRRRGLKS